MEMFAKVLRILVVDDHEPTLAVLKRLLRLEGHLVKTTAASRYALEIARGESFDIVMTDIGLPEMDGCALLAELRAIQPMKAIALTGFGMPDEVVAVNEAGFDDVLVKPISFETLIRSVEQVTKGDGPANGGPDQLSRPYAPDPRILMMKLYNLEKTLAMLGSYAERQKVEVQIAQIRHRLNEMGCDEG